jgi:tetratricopeptide (TPR) repeat protein
MDIGQYEQALNAYQQAIDLDPSFAPSHNGLGKAYRRLGRYQGAIANASGFRQLAQKELDFDFIRDDPRFQALVGE